MSELQINATLSIPIDEFQATFIRASGPGGQHVNKSSTAVQIRYDVTRSASLPDDVRRRLIQIAGNRMTTAGELIVTAQRFRSRERNRLDALERIAALVRRAAIVPKKRRRTRPSGASRKKRLDDKRKRGDRKRLRSRPSGD